MDNTNQLDTSQLSKAANDAFLAYEQACTTWRDSVVAANKAEGRASRLVCMDDIPSPIADKISELMSDPDWAGGLTGEDAEEFRLHIREIQGAKAALKTTGKDAESTQFDNGDRVGCVEKASSIEKEHRVWLWKGYLGKNKVAHCGGASTEGKSPVTLDIAARVSAGADWPDGTKNESGPQNVIVLAAEDDWADTIRPRLELAGANLDNVYRFLVKQQTVEITPSLDSDCQRLEKVIQEVGNVGLVVIDPITNYLGSKKMNMEEEIRGGILMPLSLVAKANNCSIITVGHLNKRGSDAAVLQRLMGCAAFAGVARDVFIFGNDPDDEDKYAHVMSEIRNKSAPKLKYKTEAVQVEWKGKTSEVIKVKWVGVSHADNDDVVNAPKQQEKTTTSKAVMLISGMLRGGAKRKADIDQALKDNGIDPRNSHGTGSRSDARQMHDLCRGRVPGGNGS